MANESFTPGPWAAYGCTVLAYPQDGTGPRIVCDTQTREDAQAIANYPDVLHCLAATEKALDGYRRYGGAMPSIEDMELVMAILRAALKRAGALDIEPGK